MLLATSSAWSEKGSLTLVCNGTYDAKTFGGIIKGSFDSTHDVTDTLPTSTEHRLHLRIPATPFRCGGALDGVGGAVEAFEQISKSDGQKTNYYYHLHCKPTKRMF
jgi:hypothetical protein